MTLRLGWFTSARGPGSRAMYEAVAGAIAAGEFEARFAFVFCNRDPGEDEITDRFLELVRANDHPLITRSSVRYRRSIGGDRSRPGEDLPAWRVEYDRLVDSDLAEQPFDLGVLAGYMLIFTGEFVRRHPLLNLHPALPDGPSGTWREVIHTLIRKRAAESGVMLHLAIAEVDTGPVVAYSRYPLRGPRLDALWSEIESEIEMLDDKALEASALFAAIRQEAVRYEAPLLLATVAEFATGRLRIAGGRVMGAGGEQRTTADLSDQVRERVRAGGD